jgi:hypothetical protein
MDKVSRSEAKSQTIREKASSMGSIPIGHIFKAPEYLCYDTGTRIGEQFHGSVDFGTLFFLEIVRYDTRGSLRYVMSVILSSSGTFGVLWYTGRF